VPPPPRAAAADKGRSSPHVSSPTPLRLAREYVGCASSQLRGSHRGGGAALAAVAAAVHAAPQHQSHGPASYGSPSG